MTLKPTKLLDGQVTFAGLDGLTDRTEAGVGSTVVIGTHENLQVLDGKVVLASVHGIGKV